MPSADLNNDGIVNSFDLSILLGYWGSDEVLADLNTDGIVNSFDLSILLGRWGTDGGGTKSDIYGAGSNVIVVPTSTPGNSPVLTHGTPTSSSVVLNWTEVALAETYELQRNGTTITNQNTTSFNVSGLSPETSYSFRVRAVNQIGPSPWSPTIQITTPKAGSHGGAMQTSASRFDTTWTFDKPYLVGQFVNGDPWVVAPDGLKITSISPAPTGSGASRRHGAMVDPIRRSSTGYDGRVSSHITNYSPADDATAGGFPIDLPSNTTLCSAVSNGESAGHRAVIKQVNVLTVLSEAPDREGYFRPSPIPGNKQLKYHIDTVAQNMDRVPSLTPPSGVGEPDLPWFFSDHFINDHFLLGHLWRNTRPTDSIQSGYHRDIGIMTSMALAVACTQMSGDKQFTMVRRICQYVIDAGGWFADQIARGVASHNGGNDYAHRKAILLFGAVVLDDPALYDDIGHPITWAEDWQVRYANPGEQIWSRAVDSSIPYNVGRGDYEFKHPSQWTGNNSGDAGSNMREEEYRRCCTVRTWPVQALVIMLLDAHPANQGRNIRQRFNNEAYIDYCDRWMYEYPYQPYLDYLDSLGKGGIGNREAPGTIDGSYQTAFWHQYRSSV